MAATLLGAACQSLTSPGDLVRVIEIAPAKVECYGPFPHQCYQVREVGAVEWELWYDFIEGFTFEPGFSYVVRVEGTRRKAVLQDSGAYEWRLLAVISKTPAS